MPTEPEEPLVVSIPIEGEVLVMDSPVADAQIVSRLREVLANRESQRVFLRADGSNPYARVVQVMGALNAAGLSDIVLVTDAGGPRMDE